MKKRGKMSKDAYCEKCGKKFIKKNGLLCKLFKKHYHPLCKECEDKFMKNIKGLVKEGTLKKVKKNHKFHV